MENLSKAVKSLSILFKNISKFLGNIISNRIFIVISLLSIIGGLVYFIYKKYYLQVDAKKSDEKSKELLSNTSNDIPPNDMTHNEEASNEKASNKELSNKELSNKIVTEKKVIINHPNRLKNDGERKNDGEQTIHHDLELIDYNRSKQNEVNPLNATDYIADYSNYNEKPEEMNLYDDNKKSYTEELNNIVDMLDNDKIDTLQAFEKSQDIEPDMIRNHNLTNSEIMEINKKLEQY